MPHDRARRVVIPRHGAPLGAVCQRTPLVHLAGHVRRLGRRTPYHTSVPVDNVVTQVVVEALDRDRTSRRVAAEDKVEHLAHGLQKLLPAHRIVGHVGKEDMRARGGRRREDRTQTASRAEGYALPGLGAVQVHAHEALRNARRKTFGCRAQRHLHTCGARLADMSVVEGPVARIGVV